MNSRMKTVQNWAMRGIDSVLPPRCIVSGEEVDRQGTLSPEIWSSLDFISAPHCAQCGVPFDFEVEQGVKCNQCLERPPPYKRARAALTYNDTSRDMILGFKHGDKLHSVRAFTPWLMMAGREVLEETDLIVPVPLHYRRLIMRRYNQAAVLALSLSKECGVPVSLNTLKRTRHTAVQGHMKAADRHKNVKAAFAMHPNADVKNKNIVLIDDVLTTGATVKECSKTLLSAGASQVDILTLARVVKDEYF